MVYKCTGMIALDYQLIMSSTIVQASTLLNSIPSDRPCATLIFTIHSSFQVSAHFETATYFSQLFFIVPVYTDTHPHHPEKQLRLQPAQRVHFIQIISCVRERDIIRAQ